MAFKPHEIGNALHGIAGLTGLIGAYAAPPVCECGTVMVNEGMEQRHNMPLSHLAFDSEEVREVDGQYVMVPLEAKDRMVCAKQLISALIEGRIDMTGVEKRDIEKWNNTHPFSLARQVIKAPRITKTPNARVAFLFADDPEEFPEMENRAAVEASKYPAVDELLAEKGYLWALVRPEESVQWLFANA